jgi:hypothetical protein
MSLRTGSFIPFTLSLATGSALQQALFKSEFSRERDLVLPLSTPSILWFPIAAYFFFLVFSSLLFLSITCPRRQFLQKM